MHETKIYPDGVHDLSNHEYHASFGLSRSSLMEFKRSPFHYFYRYRSSPLPVHEPTPDMVLGSLIHTLVLEPHKFDEEYAIRPLEKRSTNAGKFAYGQFIGTLSGRQEITKVQFDLAQAIADSVLSHPFAKEALDLVNIERSIYFTHKETGLQLKARPDAWVGNLVSDLKSAVNASPKGFELACVKGHYFHQAAFAKMALESLGIMLKKFLCVAVEKKPPYAIGVYSLDLAGIAWAEDQINQLLIQFVTCQDLNRWPDYGVLNMALPKYAEYDFIGELDE